MGKVQAVTFLHTKLKTFEGKIVIIPNHEVCNGLGSNCHANPRRQVGIEFFIRYGKDLAPAGPAGPAGGPAAQGGVRADRPQAQTD